MASILETLLPLIAKFIPGILELIVLDIVARIIENQLIKYYEVIKNHLIKLHKTLKNYTRQPIVEINSNKDRFMVALKKITGLIFIIAAIVILVLSYNAYITSYHKTISTSNFTFLFSGIFWDLVGILIGAVLIAIGLILAYPKGARWLANRNR